MKIRRRVMLGAAMAALFHEPAKAALFSGVAGSSPPPSGLPTTMTLVNTSGSTQAANFITPVFGHSFKKGDIPAKAVYTATISGTTMTIDSVTSGTISVGDLVFAGESAVAPWTYITGGSGTSWTVSPSQTISSSTTMWSAGTPTFTISSSVQPLSWGCQNFWSDYSLKHASFAFRCGSSIAGNGTLSVTVNSGGTTPATSARTLTDVYNQSLQVNIAGVVGLTGTYTGVVSSGGLNAAQAVYIDGAAGKWWRIWTHAGKSGTPHGQIEVYHYIGALTDSSNNLGGFRYVPRVSQPWYNNNSPALTVYAANLSWQYGAGPTTVNWNWPFDTVNFTTTTSAVCTVAASGTHNFYQGAVEGGVNAVPGVFTAAGGNLDTALSTGTVYWVTNLNPANTPANNTQFYVQSNPGLTSQITMNGNATGTMTFTPTPHILPLQSIFDLANDGQAKFFQGTGSLSADNTIMTQFNCAYLVSTGLTQPFDTSYTGTAFGGTIVDNGDASNIGSGWNYNWTPTTTGPIGLSDIGEAGEHDYLGPVTQYAARHFYNQSVLSAKIVRMIATCSDFYGVSAFRDNISGNYVNLSANNYTGLANGSASVYGRIESLSGFLQLPSGITLPPSNTQYFCVGEANGAHKPSMAFWAAFVFADPHWIDLAVEMGIGSVTNEGLAVRNYSSPANAGVGITLAVGSGGTRDSAWQTRDIIHGAIVAPNTHPDGSQSCDMLRDYANNNFNYAWGTCNSSYLGSYFYTNGRWNACITPASQPSPYFDDSTTGFTGGYMLNVLPLGVSALENADALSLLNFYSGWWNHVLNTFSGYYMYGENDFAVFLDSGGNPEGPIPSDAYYAIGSASFVSTISWVNSGSPYFTMSGFGSGYPAPSAGDRILWDNTGGNYPGGMATQTPYYIRDVSGDNFNLAATLGGTAIVPTNSGTASSGAGGGNAGPYMMSILPSWAVASTGNTPAATNAYNCYVAVKWAGFSFAKAVGATGWDTVGSVGYSPITDAATRLAVNSVSFTDGPTYLAATSL